MSRLILAPPVSICSFPRVSGDEPANHALQATAGRFSPRERG